MLLQARRIELRFKIHSKPFRCGKKLIVTEAYQCVSKFIDIESYEIIEAPYFKMNNKVFFWWVNSDGNFIVPIPADANTFSPFKEICGGKDKDGIYYGCPNYGVNKLDIPNNSNFQIIAKKNHYWNSPNNYAVLENDVFDIVYSLKKGYHLNAIENLNKAAILKK